MYNTVLQSRDNNGWGSLSFTFKANTIVNLEIITIFIQEFYDLVLFFTNSTLELRILVKYFDGRIKSLTPIQYVNKYVPLSVVVDIINCFWINRTALLDGKVLGIVINFKDLGSAPIRLCPPTPDKPTMILSKHNRVSPNPIFPSEDTLNYLDNLQVSTTLSSTDFTSSTDSTSSTPSTSTTSTTSTNSSNSSTDYAFPKVLEFTDLHLAKNRKAAKKVLSGLAGVYAIICNVTGAIYIGSSRDIGIRMVQHLVTNNTNDYLQNAFKKYRLENFTFAVVEFCDSQVLLQREQHYLDILFSLPKELRYNFSLIAGAPIAGRTHTPESKALTSASKTGYKHTDEARDKISGDNNPMYGRTGANHPMYGESHSDETRAKMSKAKSGENNPMFGKVAANAMTINVYDLDNVLVRSFTSQVEAAKWLGVSNFTVHNYIKSRKVWNNQYRFVKYMS